jgi:hypothetical protein
MALVAPMWNAFNAGELSSELDGRTDQEKYFTGCKTLFNFIPSVRGPAVRRGGTLYRGATKDNGKVWFQSFEFSSSQSYVLEFGQLYLRFWVNRGQLLDGGAPYELASPWTLDDLTTTDGTFALRVVQSGDVMWITHYTGAVAPYKLTRLGATNWTLTAVAFTTGPFDDVDPTNTVTMQASVATGTGTLTASVATFQSYHVGSIIYLETDDPSLPPAWGTNKAVGANVVWRYEGNVYESQNAATTGASPPVHLRGIANDGAVKWKYLHSGWGVARIDSLTSDTVANITVLSRIPGDITAAGFDGSTSTKRWAFGAFNSDAGWPTTVGFFRERLVYTRGRTVFMSVVGGFDDFSPFEGRDVTKETAIKLTVGADKVESFRWQTEVKDLLLGTARNELSISEQTTQQVFAADNAKRTPQTQYGSRHLAPVAVESATLFVPRSGQGIRELRYSYEIERYKAEELSVLSRHVVEAGIVDMDFQQEPDNAMWCPLANGKLALLIYNRERGVIALAPCEIGGGAVVETAAVIPKPDNTRDDLWLVCKRTINGQTVRYVEIMEDYRLANTDIRDAFFVDSGLTYSGVPVTSVAGLDHLEGATVQVLADGSPHADCVVTGGQITLTRSASKVHAGFGYASRLQPMRPEAGAQNGSGQGRTRSTSELMLRFKDTLGGRVGPSFSTMDPLKYRSPATPVGAAPSLFTGDIEFTMPARYDTDGYVCVEQNQPLPMTVVAIRPKQQVND